jgi:signal transduction histidine kinase
MPRRRSVRHDGSGASAVEHPSLRALKDSDGADLRLTLLAHELNGLLDGSLRYIRLAQSGLCGESPYSVAARQARARLDAAHDALERMATLLQRGMRPAVALTSSIFRPAQEPLIEALVHAADSLRPLADDRHIRINIDCSPRLVLSPAGPIYTIVVNAIRNSIDAIGRNGSIDIVAEMETTEGGDPTVVLDIYDDGAGPRKGSEDSVFELGFTTKAHGHGVGLALCREIVRDLGGTITLVRRDDDGEAAHRGAHLAIRFPAPNLHA